MKKTYIAPYVETELTVAEDELLATSIVDISGPDGLELGFDEDVIPGDADVRDDIIPLEW